MAIWTDYWLPGKTRDLIHSDRVDGLERVSNSICPDRHCWNRRLIEENFLPDDVHKILSIPLPNSNYSDKLVWMKETSGLYTVKSGYSTLLIPACD